MVIQVCLKATPENSDLFFEYVLNLKTKPRRGWQKKLGLKNPESVADHAYCVAAIAMVLSDSKKLDSEKILKMAILHDLAESITGDLTPEDGPKQKKEDAAMKKILSTLNPPLRKQYWLLWNQYKKIQQERPNSCMMLISWKWQCRQNNTKKWATPEKNSSNSLTLHWQSPMTCKLKK